MNVDVGDLFDYESLRGERDATMYVRRTSEPIVVLGSSQRLDVLDFDRLNGMALRRRRGGGGIVLLRPGDLWVDWWIPVGDPRWSSDVHLSSIGVGHWWRGSLAKFVQGEIVVHEGSLEGETAHRMVCFAGRGPGEVFVDHRKAMGLTQWRVREGIFMSTVVPGHSSMDVVQLLRSVPDGLESALDHQTIATLHIADINAVVEMLRADSGPWRYRTPHFDV